ncbi:hypothetical protein PRECH8_04930 [Insulibacter thermoxylanivorax]|uniref:RloB-like protein n=1 Tax=Insulibacter thermoxylanivorax TaxID=2749268 RepID=A0A916QF22_9BACL|nr:RloB family protein [Insulibacter thermoxylanivorax]GFR37197.1 hypothetical protein PRECH8_04930 [Insulibacter thermoxylanivorax]
MARSSTRRLTTYRRRKSESRTQRDTILIICVGETEKIYFNQFKLSLGKIKVKTIQNALSPLQLVERAIEEKNTGKYVQVWAVFDKDDYVDYDRAIALAEKNRVGTAYSNQAFEIWFILHFEKMTAPLHRNQYKQKLTNLLGKTYKKADESIIKLLLEKTDTAIQNARWGFELMKKNYGDRPPSNWESSTTVYQLVSELNRWK